MWSIDVCLYSYCFTFSLVFFSHLVFLPFLSLSVFSLLYFFLLLAFFPLFYCSWLPPFIPSVIVGFTPFVSQPFLASYGHLSKTAHSSTSCPAITFAQSVLVAPLSISKQNYLSCFLPLSVFVLPQWIRIKLPHHLPLQHASSGPSPHLSLLGEKPSQQNIPPKEAWAGTLEQTPIFSSPPNHTL